MVLTPAKTAAGAVRELTSARNPLLKRLRRALARGELTPEGHCGVEGRHLVEEALGSGIEVEAIVAARSAAESLSALPLNHSTATVYLVPERVFASLAQTETPQGLAALVRLPAHDRERCLAHPKALLAALVSVQDPGNVGTILRSLEAFGGTACLLTQGTASPLNAKAARASAGSLFRVPFFSSETAEETVSLCRAHRVQAIGLAPRAPRPLSELNLTQPVAFFLGGEGSGLPEEVLARMDVVAQIPLAERVDSLNAAMAATLALYETARQRGRAR